jgi:hypothetical protein
MSAEVCDGVDNNCNGTMDDGGDALCSGGQHCAGTQKCVQCDPGKPGSCGACQVCSAAGTCTPFPNNQQDPAGCTGTCRACQNGSCGAANVGTDPGNDCTAAATGSTEQCFDGECDGRGGCAITNPVTCYLDKDKDGFGDPSNAVHPCGGCAAGSVTNSKDCFDGNPSAKPGQTAYFTTHRGDNSFDYDCDGQATQQVTMGRVSCVTGATCNTHCTSEMGSLATTCGDMMYERRCVESSCPEVECYMEAKEAGIQACR